MSFSWEEDRVMERVNELAKPLFDRVYTWSVTDGLRRRAAERMDDRSRGPYAALEYVAADPHKSLFVFLDFHPYVSEAKVVRKLRDLVAPLQSTSSVVLFLSPTLELPRELEKDVSVVDYPLPTLEDIRSLFAVIEEGVASNPSLSIDLDEEERDQLLQAALGLTENEARNVFAKALARDRTLSVSDVDVIVREKEQIVRKSGVLEYFSNPDDFGAVGGLDQLKSWLSLRSGARSPRRPGTSDSRRPRGCCSSACPGAGRA